MKKIREIYVVDGVAYIPLTQGKTALIDVEDIDLVGGKNWHFEKGYAVRNNVANNEHTQYMHRLIANTPKGLFTDHKNGNKLDNQKANLRSATKNQNEHNTTLRSNNTSGFKGVVWNKQKSKWQAQIKINYSLINLGLYTEIEAAAEAYAIGAKKYHGEFARTI
tara:strand:- start:227 stop:718 length:492 start_codon:yes stop_codon:yes gene_type:complete